MEYLSIHKAYMASDLTSSVAKYMARRIDIMIASHPIKLSVFLGLETAMRHFGLIEMAKTGMGLNICHHFYFLQPFLLSAYWVDIWLVP